MNTAIRWNDFAGLQPIQFEYENTPTIREVRLSSEAAKAGDLVRVKVGGAEVEGRITDVDGSTLHVRIGRRLF